MNTLPKSTDTFFKLPWYSNIRPSKSLWDQDSFCCPVILCFQMLIQIRVCDLKLGVRKEKGGEGNIPSPCQSLVYYVVFCKKTLWQVNFLCSLLDSPNPYQDCPHLSFETLKHLLLSNNVGKVVVWEVTPSITHTEQSFFLQVYQTFFISPLIYSSFRRELD